MPFRQVKDPLIGNLQFRQTWLMKTETQPEKYVNDEEVWDDSIQSWKITWLLKYKKVIAWVKNNLFSSKLVERIILSNLIRSYLDSEMDAYTAIYEYEFSRALWTHYQMHRQVKCCRCYVRALPICLLSRLSKTWTGRIRRNYKVGFFFFF